MISTKSQQKFNIPFILSGAILLLSIFFLRIPSWASWASSSLVWLLFIAGLIFVFLGFTSKHARVGLLVLLVGSFMSYNFTINPLEGDNRNYGMVARSLLSDGDIILNEFSERLEEGKYYGIVQKNGSSYNLFPLGPSIVLAPLYALVSIDPLLDPNTAEIQAGRLATALFFGGALSLFFFLISHFEEVDQGKALLLTFIFGFCSHQLSQHLSMFWSHNAVMPFILAALLALKIERRDLDFLAGILFMLGYLMRPTAVLLVPVVTIWLWLYRRKAIGYFIAGFCLGGILVMSTNLAFFGHLVSTYSQVGRLGSSFFLKRCWVI